MIVSQENAAELGLDQHTFDFTTPNGIISLTVFARKTLNKTLGFKTTMQCDVDELFESLRDFGGGYVPELFSAAETSLSEQDKAKPKATPAPDHLGLDIWPAALELCTYLSRHPELVSGVDIIELGAGVGLPGLLAAKLGAKQAVLTDYEPSVVAFSGNNASLNNITDNCSAITLDWTQLDDLPPQHRHAYSLVLAADVLYVEELMPWFIQAAELLMGVDNQSILLLGHQSRRALIIDPVTNTPEVHDRDVAFERFQKLCGDAGLCIKVLGSRESEGFPGPFYIIGIARNSEASVLDKLPAAVWPTM